MQETKICKCCNRELPIEKFQINALQGRDPYHISTCNECRYKQRSEKKNKLSQNIEIIIDRRYKEIKPERVLKLEDTGIIPLGTDEIFVKLMDYKKAWLSNYGRMIRRQNGTYKLLNGSYDNYGALRYTLPKNVYIDGKWTYKQVMIYAARAVVQEFIVNPDAENNKFVWHCGYDKQDYYYKNLYPLNQEQYRIVKEHYMKTGDDSEGFIVDAMNDIKFKPDNWSKRCMKPTMCGIGYHGCDGVDCTSEAYIRWHDMLNRCYNEKFLERQPQYRNCRVCEEWLNFSNFKVWYAEHKIPEAKLDLDKDILFKGNAIYSPETVCFVPHEINTLFVNGKKNRGDLPLGVWIDNDKGKYRAGMSFMGRQIKLGTFDTAEEAFNRYKVYKEDFIRDMAEQYKEEIPEKVYNAMVNWKIEITD